MNAKTQPLNEILKQIRLDKNIAGNQVADSLGVSAQYFSDMEHGRRPLHPKHIVKWANALEQDPDVIAASLVSEKINKISKDINATNKSGKKLTFRVTPEYK